MVSDERQPLAAHHLGRANQGSRKYGPSMLGLFGAPLLARYANVRASKKVDRLVTLAPELCAAAFVPWTPRTTVKALWSASTRVTVICSLSMRMVAPIV